MDNEYFFSNKDESGRILNTLCKAVYDAYDVSRYNTLKAEDVINYLPRQILFNTPIQPIDIGAVFDGLLTLRNHKLISGNGFNDMRPSPELLNGTAPTRQPRTEGYSFNLALPALQA